MIKEYIAYLKDNPERLWFKRKLYGWGWTPATWQGWGVTLLYIILVLMVAFSVDENSATHELVFKFFIPLVILSVTFFRIAYTMGEKPRWQWGPPPKTDKK